MRSQAKAKAKATDVDYTTLANVKAYGDSTQTKDDTIISGLITSFSASIENYISQSFATGTINQYGTFNFYNAKVDRDGFLLVYPDINPITTVTALQYRVRGGGPAGWLALDPTQIEVTNKFSGTVVRVVSQDFGYYRWLNPQIQVNLAGGYANAGVLPADLEFAVRRLVWWAYKQKGAPLERTASPETGQITVPGYWPADIKTLLAPFVSYYTR